MDVDLIPVGRELDEAVAEHVLKQRYSAHDCWSTDIAAAWEVVEADPSIDWIIERIDKEWSVRCYKGRMSWRSTASFAELPEAICRAALKAVTHA